MKPQSHDMVITTHYIRLANLTDVPSLMRLQRASYPSWLNEDVSVFDTIIAKGRSVVAVENQPPYRVVGYMLVHCVTDPDTPPSLNGDIPITDSKHIFVHDAVVEPSFRRMGIGSQMVDAVFARCEAIGTESVSIVSLPDAIEFWSRHEFAPCTNPVSISSYGHGAVYMRLTKK
jgi:ribosomal protein S18 acetylase RimI-like enzyme